MSDRQRNCVYAVQSRFDRWTKLPYVAIFNRWEDAEDLRVRMLEDMDPYYQENFSGWIWVETIELDKPHRVAEQYCNVLYKS